MKKLLVILLIVGSYTLHAQKTSRQTFSEHNGIMLQRNITERDGIADTVFLMMGQNAKYTHIIKTIVIKHGSLADISDMLNECIKFLPEPEDTSLEYKGNTLLSMGNSRLMVFGTGRDSNGYILLDKKSITKMQGDIAKAGL